MSDIILEVQDVYKNFRLYHEKRNSIYETITSVFNRKKYYETLPVLQGISFSLKRGEMLGILGRNGVGKTTLLRLIAGIYKPDKGRIIKNGTLIPFLALGSGFQTELTARTNVILYGVLLGMNRKEITKKVDEIISFAELEKFADTKLKNFSSGMYARLAFATAVQVDPDILLMDEIISVGDLSFQEKSYETFLSFKKRNKSIILVTHSMEPVKQYCDKAILIDGGRILASGEPDKVVQEYQRISLNQN